MPVSYKVKKYVNPNSAKNGQYYARAVVMGEMDLDAVAEKIQQNCSMKKSDVRAVLTELVEVMQEALQDSRKVRLNGLGSFKIGLHSKLQEKAADVTTSTITGYKVNFQPEYTIDASGKRSTVLLNGTRAQAYGEYAAGVNDKDQG